MSLNLLCAAMPQEAVLLIPRLAPASPTGGRPVWVGELGPRRVVLILTGMGMVNAAQAVTASLEAFRGVKRVINFGCAGAYAASGLEIGRVAAADQVVHADQGVTGGRRWRGLDAIGIPLERNAAGEPIYNRLPVDRALSEELRSAGDRVASGVFASVARVSGDPDAARRLEERWGALVEDMESAAVAQVAAHYGLAFASVRGVSNIAGGRELDVAAGARAAQELILAWGGLS